ncbi:MAG: hypothetical protein ACE368_07675 [Paracoccaceae bacterium]
MSDALWYAQTRRRCAPSIAVLDQDQDAFRTTGLQTRCQLGQAAAAIGQKQSVSIHVARVVEDNASRAGNMAKPGVEFSDRGIAFHRRYFESTRDKGGSRKEGVNESAARLSLRLA